MNLSKNTRWNHRTWGLTAAAVVLIGALAAGPAPAVAQTAPAASNLSSDCEPSVLGSPFIPVDSWIYPAVVRLYGLGYGDHVFIGLRPWTRSSLSHMLENVSAQLEDGANGPSADEAQGIYDKLIHEVGSDISGPCGPRQGSLHLESTYSVARGISGVALRDSSHLGSLIVNDYGRPYQDGFSNYTGISGYATAGRFSAYMRGEFQGAESGNGYSQSVYQALAANDQTLNPATGIAYPGQSTMPFGNMASTTRGRIMEAYVGFQIMNNVISFGKQDEWLGPAVGGSFAYSNNAENLYALHINRTEPLYVPFLSRLVGPFRYEFLIGETQGHNLMRNPLYNGNNVATQPNVINPGNPWIHLEKISMRPTRDLEVGFERTAFFGGEGHSPVTLHTFLKSFASLASTDQATKYSRYDPGARFGSFDVSYRLPFVRNWFTLYADGEVHDDVSPIDAPRRAAWRPGLYLSHTPGLPKLDFRVEGMTSDPPVDRSVAGEFMYWEGIEREGYTNQGQIFGDWMGREDKGGQAWSTWHLSGNEWIQANFRHQKASKDFIPGSTTPIYTAGSVIPHFAEGGTTLNDFGFQVVKRIGHDFQIDGRFNTIHWKIPLLASGTQSSTATTIQLTWFPDRKVVF